MLLLLLLTSQLLAVDDSKTVNQIEDGRILIEREREPGGPAPSKAWRDLWKLRVRPNPDYVVLTSFEMVPDETLSIEGLPKNYTIETIRYSPEGTVTELVSYVAVRNPGPWNEHEFFERYVCITGFGHSFVLPPELGLDAYSDASSGNASAGLNRFVFTDHRKNPHKRITVKLAIKCISRDDARKEFARRNLEIPDFGSEGWSVTLPPTTEKIEEVMSKHALPAPKSEFVDAATTRPK